MPFANSFLLLPKFLNHRLNEGATNVKKGLRIRILSWRGTQHPAAICFSEHYFQGVAAVSLQDTIRDNQVGSHHFTQNLRIGLTRSLLLDELMLNPNPLSLRAGNDLELALLLQYVGKIIRVFLSFRRGHNRRFEIQDRCHRPAATPGAPRGKHSCLEAQRTPRRHAHSPEQAGRQMSDYPQFGSSSGGDRPIFTRWP
jgi:hypothetical protein